VLPLVAGLCFGFGYGVTGRLLAQRSGGPTTLGQTFDVKSVPGTSLESLRMRYGAEKEQLRGDLGLIELEKTRKEGEAQARAEEDRRRQLALEEERRARSEAERPLPPPEPEPVAEPIPEPAVPPPAPEPTNPSGGQP
jgi:hypothetical protein